MNHGKYTVNEVEERSGVPAGTLRQWERRYGFPKPERSASGYRLYSDEDLRHIEAMKRYIAQGIPASRAADLVRQEQAIEQGPRPLEDLRADLLRALLELDESKAERLFSEAYALHPVNAVLQQLIQNVMVELGELWHRGKISAATEHWASGYVQGRLQALFNLSAGPREGPLVIVACAPGEQHELGALLLAVMLRRAGYHVYYLGADTPIEDLVGMAKTMNAAAVLISATMAGSVKRLFEARELLEEIAPIAIYGGRAFQEKPDLAGTLGGRYLAGTAEEALERLHALIQDVE